MKGRSRHEATRTRTLAAAMEFEWLKIVAQVCE